MSKLSENAVRPSIGLSACLAGLEVRYDGRHKRSSLCLNELGQHFSLQTFCPEVAAGFGTPRPKIQLTGHPDKPVLRYTEPGNGSGINLDDQLRAGFKAKLEQISELDGYILIKNSPSCGKEQVKVLQEDGQSYQSTGRGLFAAALIEKYPHLPVEEEWRLHDAQFYENFVLRVYAHQNFRSDVLSQANMKSLITFHSAYKYVLMAHGQSGYKCLGQIAANHEKLDAETVITRYREQLTQALKKPATRSNHSNTLLHILGYLKKTTGSAVRLSICDAIDRYREGQTPLAVPLTLLKRHIEQDGDKYIRAQRYLQAYPEALGLQNNN